MINEKLLISFIVFIMCVTNIHYPLNIMSDDKPYNKITEELQACLDEMYDDDMISVYIWMEDINYDDVKLKTFEKTGISDDTITKEADAIYEPLCNIRASNITESYVPVEELEKIEVKQDECDIDTDFKLDEKYLEFFEKTKEIREELSKK